MDLDRIKENAYDKYLRYHMFCDKLGTGFVPEYYMLRKQILENHERKISFDKGKMLWYTYIDNKTKITCRDEEGLKDKLVDYYLGHFSGLYMMCSVWDRAMSYYKENDFLAPSTICRYQADYERFIQKSFLNCMDIRNVTETDMSRFMHSVMSLKLSSRCIGNLKTIIRLLFSYARMNENMDCLYVSNFFNEMKIPRRAFREKTPDINRVFRDDEYDTLIRNLDLTKSIDMGIYFCFFSGLRVGELCALRKEHFDFTNNTVRICISEKVAGRGKNRVYYDEIPKSYKIRDVYLSKKGVEIAKKLYVASNDYLFPDKDGHKHARCFDARLRRICKKCGLPEFSMHDIRRTYGSHLLDSDVTEIFVKNQMGHSDIKTTRTYYYYSTKRQEEFKRMAEVSSM